MMAVALVYRVLVCVYEVSPVSFCLDAGCAQCVHELNILNSFSRLSSSVSLEKVITFKRLRCLVNSDNDSK